MNPHSQIRSIKTLLTLSLILSLLLTSTGAFAAADVPAATETTEAATAPADSEIVPTEPSTEAVTEPVTEPATQPATQPAPPPTTQPPVTPAVPAQPLSIEGYPLVESFAPNLPADFTLNLLYKKYLTNYDYIVSSGSVNIRSGPGNQFAVVRKSGTYEKMSLVESVKGEYTAKYNSDLWYRIYWYDKTGIRTGYVYGPLVQLRRFDLARKIQEAKAVQNDLASANMVGYVNNYKNRVGQPPLLGKSSVDAFGNDRSQSAPGYASLDNLSSFVYVQDGTLLILIGQSGGYYQCRLPGKQTVYWVPKKYITLSTSIKGATQMVVVDRKQQNAAVFEKGAAGWQLVSYQVVTTGAKDQYRYPTPLGAFMAIEKKTKFLYLHDVTQEVDGYAPNAIRFSGGAYLHGVPVDFKKDPTTGALVDPGQAESLSTLGTVPRSHKCVRNYTSHAKFLYDWVKIGQAAVIVIE